MPVRLKILTISVFIFGILIIGRLFELQILKHSAYLNKNYNQSSDERLIPAERGKIFINDQGKLYPLAINIQKYNLIASPAEIDNPSEWIKKMAPYLDFKEIFSDSDELTLIKENQETDRLKIMLTRLSQKNDFYELLKKDIDIKEVEEIKKLELDGVSFETIPRRYYPEESLFSHILGFVSHNETCDTNRQCFGADGQYGLEEYFNKELAGVSGQSKLKRAPGGYLITASDNIIKPPKNGIDLVLTLDRSIQFFTCSVLEEALSKYQAESGSIVVVNSETGAILSLCNKPDFNPNQYFKEKEIALFKNSVITSSFEPGSVFKIITMAAALDAQKVTPETTYIDTGSITIDDYTIKNVKDQVFNRVTMTNVLENSINTGAVFAAQALGRKEFRNYVRKFGFGSLTNIELSGEAIGDIDNLEKRPRIYLATASFGQGITVTPLQFINAVVAIANSGKLMKPYLIDSFIENGEQKVQPPQFIRQVISPSTASQLTAMMVSVLENGYGRLAKVDGYFVAGKTGTAQVAQKSGGYSEKVIHSFIGFAPATKPKFVALVKLDNPQNGNFADSTAAPTFGKLAAFILKYYNIPPDKKE